MVAHWAEGLTVVVSSIVAHWADGLTIRVTTVVAYWAAWFKVRPRVQAYRVAIVAHWVESFK